LTTFLPLTWVSLSALSPRTPVAPVHGALISYLFPESEPPPESPIGTPRVDPSRGSLFPPTPPTHKPRRYISSTRFNFLGFRVADLPLDSSIISHAPFLHVRLPVQFPLPAKANVNNATSNFFFVLLFCVFFLLRKVENPLKVSPVPPFFCFP